MALELRYNLVKGNLGAAHTAAVTTLTLAAALQEGGVNVPTIVAPNLIVLRLDQEIVHLTAYTAGATTGTIARAQRNTVATTHPTGTEVRIVPTKESFIASEISILDTAADFTATDVEGALAELQADAEADATGLSDHLADTADAHDASAISVLDTAGAYTGTDVEAVLAELPGAFAQASDPQGWGIAFNYDPANMNTTATMQAANRAHYYRCRGGAPSVSKLAVAITVSAGNICLAVVTGAVGRSSPTTRKATTGSVACPAIGNAEVALGATVAVDARTDWMAVTSDDATTAFRSVAGASYNGLGIGTGFAAYQSTAMPIPDPVVVTSVLIGALGVVIVGVP